MSYLGRKLERLLEMFQSVLQFALHTQQDSGVAHDGCHSILVIRFLIEPECLVVYPLRGGEIPSLDRNQTEVQLSSDLPLLIADGSIDDQRLGVQPLSGGEIPLIDGDFRRLVQGLGHTEAVSRGFVDLSSFLARSLRFFVFAKIS